MNDRVAVGDADGLIALTLEKDPNHVRAIAVSNEFLTHEVTVVFPVTVFPEAITSLTRAANQPEKARLISRQLQEGAFHVEYLDEVIVLKALELFNQTRSKQNTLFDAIVAATADKLGTKIIFSFDSWYPKLGFRLAG